jgi:hypothetical protein
MNGKYNAEIVPSFAKGRKGGISVLDGIVRSLWVSPSRRGPTWPAKSFGQLIQEVSILAGYPVPTSTVRSTIYGHSHLFEKVVKDGHLLWRLSDEARQSS